MMNQSTNSLEAIKLISDWAKWIITIETASIAVIAALLSSGNRMSKPVKIMGTLSVVSFLISIVATAMLLATLPEITQNLTDEQNIWTTRDSVAYDLFHLTTQGFAVFESVFFGVGIACFVTMVAARIWAGRDATVGGSGRSGDP